MKVFLGFLLVAFASLALPDAQLGNILQVDDWGYDIKDGPKFFAATINPAGNILGQYCDIATTNCYYAVSFGTTCEKTGDKHPALINSDTGAISIDLICGDKLNDNENMMFIANFDALDNTLSAATRIGFVIPMKGDEFKAIRFSLKGASKAIQLMRKAALKRTGGLKAQETL